LNRELDKKEFRLGCIYHMDVRHYNRCYSKIFLS